MKKSKKSLARKKILYISAETEHIKGEEVAKTRKKSNEGRKTLKELGIEKSWRKMTVS